MCILTRVKQWLFDTWKVSVPDEWLSACLDWIQEQQETLETFESQCGHVFDQWLISDLNDIGASCFPANLNQHNKLFLQGVYAVQINNMVDISVPMYKQLQKVAGTENENSLVNTATQQTQRQDDIKEKSNRMMMMILSDGSQEIFGIERQHIPSLNNNLTFGTKVIIHGGVLCRKGVLLLNPENLSILGGEAETMIEQFTSIKIIEDKLRANTERFNPAAGQNPDTHLRKEFHNHTILSSADLSVDSKKLKYKNSQSNFKHQSQQMKSCSDSDYRPNIKSEPMSSFVQVQGSSNYRVKVERSMHLPKVSSDPFSDDSTDLIFEEVMRRNGIGDVKSSTPQMEDKKLLRSNLLFTCDDDNLVFEDGINITPGDAAFQNRPITRKVEVNESVTITEVTRHCGNTTTTYCDRGKKRLKLSNSDNLFITPYTNPSTDTHNNPTTDTCNNPSTDTHNNLSTDTHNNPSTDAHNNPSTNLSTISSSLERKNNRIHNPPFEYIRNILKENKSCIYFVKAYISTVTSKLEHSEGRAWSFSARLDDGSCTLDVHFHNKLLTKLIGFSASECHDMKKRVKTEPHLKQVILRAIKQFQDILIKLSVIFELHVVPSSSSSPSPPSSQTPLLMMMPTPNKDFSYIVMNYRKVTREDVSALRQIVS